MLRNHNLTVVQQVIVVILDMFDLARHFKVQHLIEITIVQPAVPTYRNGVGAHDIFHGGRIVGFLFRAKMIIVIVLNK